MVLTASLGADQAQPKISGCIENISAAIKVIKASRESNSSRISHIVLDYYRDIYQAERRAMKAMQQELSGSL